MKDFAQRVSSSRKKPKKTKTIFRSKNRSKPVFNYKIILSLLAFSIVVIATSLNLFKSNLEIFKPAPVSENSVSITFPEELKEQKVLVEIKEVLDKSDCLYILQVEAYGKEEFAAEMLYKLTSMDLNPFIQEINKVDRKLFGVMLGPFMNKSDINNAREVVVRIGLSPIIKTRCKIQ